jgi:hypothetical protein
MFGATTSIVADTQVSELEKLEKLNPETRLVTLTVGGADLGFRDVLTTCTANATACKVRSRLHACCCGSREQSQRAIWQNRSCGARARIVGLVSLLFEGDAIKAISTWTSSSTQLTRRRLTSMGPSRRCRRGNDDGNIQYVDVTEEFKGHGVLKLINAKPSDTSAFIHSAFVLRSHDPRPGDRPCRI